MHINVSYDASVLSAVYGFTASGVGDGILTDGLCNDMLNGASGWDQAAYASNYAASTGNGGDSVTIAGAQGTDTRVQFHAAISSDAALAIASAPPSDTNGDGFSDLMWQSVSGQLMVWQMNGTTLVDEASVGPNPGPSWRVKGTGDFNGDGKADILWQNDSGQAAIWFMNGLAVTGGGFVSPNPGPAWHAVSTGDFNGDGKSDIVWQNDSGQAAVWLMDGTTVIGGGLAGSNPGTSWHIKGAGDFNADGASDILWQNDNGQVAIWLMNGSTVAGGGLAGSNPGTGWHVVGAGDFDGDHKSDVLFGNDPGQAQIWLMNGLTVSSAKVVNGSENYNTHIKGTADLNGDGKSDIVWQHTTGLALGWLMNGTTITTRGQLGPYPGGGYWDIANYGVTTRPMANDFDGDHFSDLLWQNDSGQVAIWQMNGTSVTGGGLAGPNPDPSWHAKARATSMATARPTSFGRTTMGRPPSG